MSDTGTEPDLDFFKPINDPNMLDRLYITTPINTGTLEDSLKLSVSDAYLKEKQRQNKNIISNIIVTKDDITKSTDRVQQDKYVRKESFTISLDSRNATIYSNGSCNSEITFELKYPIIIPKDCIYMTWVTNAFTTPLSWYFINSTNNYLSLNLLSVHYDIYIPYGNYNMNTFIIQLTSQLTGFTITKNTINNKLTLTDLTSEFTINSNSTIYQVMGFVKNQALQSINKTLTMPFTCNFQD